MTRSRNDGATDDRHGWEVQLRRGSLELAILASLWQKKLYGLEILRVLESTSALGVAEGTLYLILSRLKAEGAVEAEWVDARSGHPRKYYWLSASGRDRLRRMVRTWKQFSANLEALIEPVLDRKEAVRAQR
ncbi:MAG: PadR family transcriptional regulator [Betaproteobacteria bacterium]